MRKAFAIGAVVVCAGAVAGALASAGGRGPQLSADYLAVAKAPCERFNATVEPLKVGAGFEDLIRQINTFSTARAKLRDELDALVTGDDDRKRLGPLLDDLAEGNRILIEARTLAGDGQFRLAYKRLDDFGRLSDAQDRLAARLGLGVCG